jgi:VDE lipocalin domain
MKRISHHNPENLKNLSIRMRIMMDQKFLFLYTAIIFLQHTLQTGAAFARLHQFSHQPSLVSQRWVSSTDDITTNTIGSVGILIPSKDADIVKSRYGRKSPVGNPTILDAATQLADKIFWFSDGTVTAKVVSSFDDLSDDSSLELLNMDVLVALGLSSGSDLEYVSKLFSLRQRQQDTRKKHRQCQLALDCSDSQLTVFVGPYDEENVDFRMLIPWTKQASGFRLSRQMTELLARWTSDDFAVALLLFLNQFSGNTIDWVKHSIDATWEKGPFQNAKEFYSMISKCGNCITKCLADDTCKTCLTALTAVDTRDQVSSYRTIVSFESEILKEFSLCILQKNNVFNCDAKIPNLPEVQPTSSWRGQPLSFETARKALIGHLKVLPELAGSLNLEISWKVACGANVAYDQFPCQNQIFYESTNGKSMWYDPVFRAETIDGRNVWCKRHYRVRDGPVAGTFRFSVLDNGVTSNEFWTIVSIADDMSWIVFHYAGAASVVGQRYLGGLLCTPDGLLPPTEQLPKVWDAFKSAGIQPWELYIVDNDINSSGALEAGPPPLTYFRDQATLKRENV